MHVTYATIATPGQENEDYVIAGPSWVAVLDGATAPTGIESGCIHDVPWLVRHLAAAIAHGLSLSGKPLTDILADAIRTTCDAHADTCDLYNPSSPSSTVAMVRLRDNELDYLALADSPIILDISGEIRPIIDDSTSRLPSYTPEAVRDCRNQPGGFWVASTKPEAAYNAVHGSVLAENVGRAALMTDGGSRYVERFGLSGWLGLMDLLDTNGPNELLRRVRAAELTETEEDRQRERRRGKRHDDATAVFLRLQDGAADLVRE